MWKYYARLYHWDTREERLFEIIDYNQGFYYVYIDFVFVIKLDRIVAKWVSPDSPTRSDIWRDMYDDTIIGESNEQSI